MVQRFAGVDVGQACLGLVIEDSKGRHLARQTLPISVAGRKELLASLRASCRNQPAGMHVAVEDPHGVVPATLHQARFDVRVVRPMAVARARDAATAAGAKDDLLDATMLADLIRTQPHQHHPLPSNSPALGALFAATRAHREQLRIVRALNNQLHAHLAGYYPAAARTFQNRETAAALATLRLAASPREAQSLRATTLRQALSFVGSHHAGLDKAKALLVALRADEMRLPAEVEAEMADRTRSLLASMVFERAVADAQGEHVLDLYEAHPLYPIYASFPALSGLSGARMLAELGDDPLRYRTARGWQASAGMRPVTKASGLSSYDHRRYVHNRILGAAVFMWVLPLRNCSPAAQAYYERRRAAGDRFGTATRKVGCAYLGILWRCVRDGTKYDEQRALRRFDAKSSDNDDSPGPKPN